MFTFSTVNFKCSKPKNKGCFSFFFVVLLSWKVFWKEEGPRSVFCLQKIHGGPQKTPGESFVYRKKIKAFPSAEDPLFCLWKIYERFSVFRSSKNGLLSSDDVLRTFCLLSSGDSSMIFRL